MLCRRWLEPLIPRVHLVWTDALLATLFVEEFGLAGQGRLRGGALALRGQSLLKSQIEQLIGIASVLTK